MTAATDGTAPWCRWCDKEVKRVGRDTVHADTGRMECATGTRVAVATMVPPSIRREAREISEEFGHRWQVSTDLGVFYAVPKTPAGTPVPAAGTPVPVDASTAEELRRRLRVQEEINGFAEADAARREAANGAQP